MGNQDRWADAQRLESWAGEVRVNFVRLVALIVYYAHHLASVYIFRDAATGMEHHVAVTGLILAWACAAVVLHYFLLRRWVPPALKYVATGWDLVAITLLLLISRDPKTALTALYFLVVFAAALRLSLPLVAAATAGGIVAYAFFLGYVRFWLEVPKDERLSRSNQFIFIVALAAAGVLAAQVVRQARRLVGGYPVIVEESSED
jgi:hypothetical protein